MFVTPFAPRGHETLVSSLASAFCRKKLLRRGLVAAVLALAATGASSADTSVLFGTEPEALSHANRTATLLSLLSAQLAELQRTDAAAESTTKTSLQEQKQVLTMLQGVAAGNMDAAKSAGNSELVGRVTELLSNTEKREAKKASAASENAAYASTLAGLMKPLPNVTKPLTEVQTEVLKMGKNLGWETRFKESEEFVKALQKGVNDAKDKIESAKTAAATAAAGASASVDVVTKDETLKPTKK